MLYEAYKQGLNKMSNTITSLSEFKGNIMRSHKYRVSAPEHRTWTGFFRGREQTILFHSKKEMLRFDQLLFLLKAGEIRELQLQERFLVSDEIIGKKLFKSFYFADFTYFGKGDGLVVEDVKGFRTAIYKAKLKKLRSRYPDVVFLET